jgi:hypothetical protein
MMETRIEKQSFEIPQSRTEIQYLSEKKGVFVLPAMVQSSSQSDEVLAKVQEFQDHHSVEKPRNQRVMIRFLCGAIFQVVTFYCPPKRRSAKDENVPEERHGISPEFSLYGFVKGCSPALEEKVARASAFYPSFSVAKEELSREDVETDVKTVPRISMQCGGDILVMRSQMVKSSIENKLEQETILSDKKVVVE